MFIELDDYLVVSVNNELTDKEWQIFQTNILNRSKRKTFKGILLDISNIVILDSYASNTINKIIKTLKLIGQEVVIIGIQPEVAFSMIQLGIYFNDILTALNFEDAKKKLNSREAND